MSALRPLYDSIRELDTCDLQQLLRWSVQAQLLDFPGYSLQPSAMAEDGMTRIKYLEKADTREGLMEEAKSFRYCAAKVDAAFERVRKGLEKVDASDYKDKDGKPIQKLQPTWVGYQRRWRTLLWGSREVATKTEAYIKDFLEVIVPIVEEAIKSKDDLDVADARLDLDQFIKRKDPQQLNPQETVNSAQNYSQDFADLKHDLETFLVTFDPLFAKVDLSITEKRVEIKQDIMRMIVSMGLCIALGVTICVAQACIGKVGVLASLRSFADGEGTVQVVTFGAVAAITELTRLEGLQTQLKHLQGLRVTLENQKTNILDTCGCLDRFVVIWGLVRHDAEEILTALSGAVGDQGSKKALMRRINLMKAPYTTLLEALNLYATTINLSKVM